MQGNSNMKRFKFTLSQIREFNLLQDKPNMQEFYTQLQENTWYLLQKIRMLSEKNQIKRRYPSTLHCFVGSLSHFRQLSE